MNKDNEKNANINCNNQARTRPNPNFSFKKLHFISSNADVLTPDKLLELKNRINQRNQPDIIMIQEAKPKNFRRELTKTEFDINEYDIEWSNMKQEEPGRGLITYVRKGITYKQVFFDIPFIEYLAVTIDLNKKEKLLVVNIYHSPNSDDANTVALNNLILNIAEERSY